MDSFLPARVDRGLKSHPAWMAALVFLLALIALWAMVSAGGSLLVYEGF